MVENYMDYSDDQCMNIFTQGQKVRMQAVIAVSPRRKSLIDANLCTPPVADVPTTNFSVANPNCILLGSTVDFTDLSSNFPTEWHWTFEGGDPAVSNERNPTIQYNSPGSYSVSLWTKNSLGNSDTLQLDGLIVVTNDGICRDFNNFENGFTPSLLKLSDFGNYTGYLTGSNSLKSTGLSEFFENECGY
jgi:PKD repeat protein